MSIPPEVVLLTLTPEQRELVRSISGHDVDAIELHAATLSERGGPLRGKWRFSADSHVPRQAWIEVPEDDKPAR